RDRETRLAAHAATFVRHPSAGGGRRPARGSGDARSRGHLHDTDLHTRRPRVSAKGASALSSAGMILVIDNYDSFTFNLVQYLGELGADTMVRRNDEIDVEDIGALSPSAIVIS